MKRKNVKVLPKTAAEIVNGGLYLQAVRCGKSGCRCASGELHTGYHYFFTRVNGKLHKYYVPKDAIDSFSELVNKATAQRRSEIRNYQQSRHLLKKMRATVREVAKQEGHLIK